MAFPENLCDRVLKVLKSISLLNYAGAEPRVGLGWTDPPHFFEDRFSNSSKFDEKVGGSSCFPSQRLHSIPSFIIQWSVVEVWFV